MAVEIVSSRQVAQSHGIKCLIYGKSGAGKTYLSRTAPRPIILSAESGLLSLNDIDLPVFKVKDLKDLYDFYAWIQVPQNGQHFDTIYMDSISDIAEVILANSKKVVKDNRQVYSHYADELIPLIKAYRDMPNKHVVMVAKQEQNKDEATGMVLQGPMMPGSKVGQQLPYLFDEVFRLGIGKDGQTEYRYLQTALDMQHEAKDRSGCLDAFEPADLSHIFNKILSGKKRS
jgi:phage nucleotide-binding protein